METTIQHGDREILEAWVEEAYEKMPVPTWFMVLKYRYSLTREESEKDVRRFITELNRLGPKDHRNQSRFGYIFCAQYHENKVIHWHGVIDDKYTDPEEAKRIWAEISRGGELHVEPYDPNKYGIWYVFKETQYKAIPIRKFPKHKRI